MLFESFPDTLLNNVRKQTESPSPTSSSDESSTFFHSSNACVPKLTKEQLDLHREFLRLGSLLMGENVDLFHHAFNLLSHKHDLKTVTPGTCVSDIIPQTKFARQYNKTQDADGSVAPKASNRKYVLPKDVAEKEFYQCMVCKERRATNSFGSSHNHNESARGGIRWYCPLCDSFFAVTHRGYHVKNRHSDVCVTVHTETVDEQKSTPASQVDPASLKRTSEQASTDEDVCEFESFSPAAKVQHSISPSAESLESSCFANDNDIFDGSSPSVGSVSFSPCQTVQQDSLSLDDNEEDYQGYFGVFLPEQQSESDSASLFPSYSN